MGILAYNMFELIDDYFMFYNRNICLSVVENIISIIPYSMEPIKIETSPLEEGM